jgi:hypothetical protein
MVAMLGKVLRYPRLHAVLSSIMTFLSLRNAIQCRRSWQGCGRSGSAVLPTSVIKAFVDSQDASIRLGRSQIRLHSRSVSLRHTVGLVIGQEESKKSAKRVRA